MPVQNPIELSDLGLTVTDKLTTFEQMDLKQDERLDTHGRELRELRTQLQYLQGAGGLLEPLSNVAGYKQNTHDAEDPTLTGGVTYIGQAQLLLAGDGVTFAQPDNSPYLRISASKPLICIDYVVSSDGTGTHETLASAVADAITAQVNATIFLCEDVSEEDIEIGGIDSSQSITILSWQDRWATITALTSDMFQQTTNGGEGTEGGLWFKNVGLKVQESGKAVLKCTAGTEMRNLWFNHVHFLNSNGYLLRNTNALEPLGNIVITVEYSDGQILGFFQNEGSTPPDQLIARNNKMTMDHWWKELAAGTPGTDATNAANFTFISNGYYTVSKAIKITASGNHDRWKFENLTVVSGCSGAHFRHDSGDTNHSGVHFENILFLSLANDTDFGDFQGPATNPQNNLFIHGIHGVVTTGVTPSGTFLTVDSDITNVYVDDVWAPDWGTVYSGPDVANPIPNDGSNIDHGGLDGLSDDDHSVYALLAGRSGGQTLYGSPDAGENMVLISTSDASKGSVVIGSSNNFIFEESANRITLGGDVTMEREAVNEFTFGSDDLIRFRTIEPTTGSNHIRLWSGSSTPQWLHYRYSGGSGERRVGNVFSYFSISHFFEYNANDRWTLAYDNTASTDPDVSTATAILYVYGDGSLLNAGHHRVGSVSAPTNTTDGDLTFIRAFVNDDSNFSIAFASSDPRITFDTNDYLQFTRVSDTFSMVVDSTTVMDYIGGATDEFRFDSIARFRAPSGNSGTIVVDTRDAGAGKVARIDLIGHDTITGIDWYRKSATDTRIKNAFELEDGVNQDPDLVMYNFTGAGGVETKDEILRFVNSTASVRLDASNQLQIRDDAMYIYSSVDGQMDIDADVEVEITAPTIQLLGNVDVRDAALSANRALTIFSDYSTSASHLRLAPLSGTNRLIITTGTGYASIGYGAAGASEALRVTHASGQVRVFQELQLDADLNHDGSNIGFFGTAPASQAAAYTQTYSTADRTHANPTASAPGDLNVTNSSPWGYGSEAEADTVWQTLDALVADLADVKQLVNAIIDDLQSYGLVQ